MIPARLYADHHFATPSGKAQLRAITFENRSEQPTAELPLILTTGRVRDHWHTMTKTSQVNRLRSHIDAPFCEIHPNDAHARGIADGDILTVRNPRGEVRVKAVVTDTIRQGVIFLPMHFGRRLSPGDSRAHGRANNVTSPRIDPVSKEPDLKLAAVQVERFAPPRRRIVIVGAGAAAFAFIQEHRRFNQSDEIVMLGGEDLPVYDRVLLPHYIQAGGGEEPWQTLVRADGGTLLPNRVVFHPNTLVARIDRDGRQVFDLRGRSFGYDVLVLATGSRPAVHYDGPMPERGVFTLRSRKDADAILAAASANASDAGAARQRKRAVIHGGGLLGLELADALRQRGCTVTILQRSDRLMGKQLDAIASSHVAEELSLRGIDALFRTALVELVGEESVRSVRVIQEGAERSLACDLFVFATGTVPNKELAGAARLDCVKGILVNEYMQTSDAAIFAVGECAQFEDYLAGTTAGVRTQAQAAAEYLHGHEHAPFRPVPTGNVLKIEGVALAAAGITDPPAEDTSYEVVSLHDRRRRLYQKCVIQNDRLVGVICLGETTGFAKYLDWIQSGLELEQERETLLRGGVAARQPVDGKLVCSCHQVGAGTIEKVAPECADLQGLCAVTQAGSGCGSCRPEVAAILARVRKLVTPAKRAVSCHT